MAEPKKGRGCFFYGCVTVIILAVLLAVAALIGGRMIYKKVHSATSATPAAVEPVKLSDKDGDTLVNQVAEYKKAIASGQSMPPLELTSDQLDYLVRNSPDAAQLRNNAQVIITNNEIQAALSIPMDHIPGFKGRFLNGQARFSLEVKDGTMFVNMKSMEVKGKPIPNDFMQGLKRPFAIDDPALLKNIEKAEIRDDKLIITPRPR